MVVNLNHMQLPREQEYPCPSTRPKILVEIRMNTAEQRSNDKPRTDGHRNRLFSMMDGDIYQMECQCQNTNTEEDMHISAPKMSSPQENTLYTCSS